MKPKQLLELAALLHRREKLQKEIADITKQLAEAGVDVGDAIDPTSAVSVKRLISDGDLMLWASTIGMFERGDAIVPEIPIAITRDAIAELRERRSREASIRRRMKRTDNSESAHSNQESA